MGRLQGKVAIVTGAGGIGNIGLAICEAFLREGAAVVGTDLRQDQASAVNERIGARVGTDRFRYVAHDVTDAKSWRSVLAETVGAFGGLDVLVNNAGIASHGGIESTTLEDLRRVMAVNHDALFIGLQVCVPALAQAVARHPGGGAVINNLSIGSFMANANNVSYHVSKAAGRMLTLCAAVELGPKKIRVNSVHPGVTMTPLMRRGMEAYVEAGVWPSVEAAEEGLKAMSLLDMTSTPEDAAHAFVYLASEEARFVTGAAICHDGGLGRRY